MKCTWNDCTRTAAVYAAYGAVPDITTIRAVCATHATLISTRHQNGTLYVSDGEYPRRFFHRADELIIQDIP